MNSYIIFFVALIVGIFLLFFGIYNFRKFYKINQIITFSFNQRGTEVFLKKGKYTIAILGGSDVKNLPISIVEIVKSKKIDVFENTLKYKYFKDGKFGVDYGYFSIDNESKYHIYLRNHDDISVKQSVPKMLSAIADDINPDHLSLAVKQYASPITFIIGIISVIVGVGVTLLSIVYILYKNGIIVPTN